MSPQSTQLSAFAALVQECCLHDTDDCFTRLADNHGFTIHLTDDGRRFAYRLGSLPVVGVCHLDTVPARQTTYTETIVLDDGTESEITRTIPADETCTLIQITPDDIRYKDQIDNGRELYPYILPDDIRAQSIRLDDRLGLAGLLWLAVEHDITIICCDDEEIGSTTGEDAARWITSQPVNVNWLFELDRRGLQPATYQYSSSEWDEIIKDYSGQTLANGSFSDISSMDSLGRKAVNFGIGYHQEHSTACHAYLSDTMSVLHNVSRMLTDKAATTFEHTVLSRSFRCRSLSLSRYRDEWEDDRPFITPQDDDSQVYGHPSDYQHLQISDYCCEYCQWPAVAILSIGGLPTALCPDCLVEECEIF